MNEQLEQTINDILTKSMSALEQGGEWFSGEIPEVINQLLAWDFTASVLGFFVALPIVVGWIVGEIKLVKELKKRKLDLIDWIFGYLFVGSLCRILAILLVFALEPLVWLKIWIAPKLYLLEYAADLIK